VNNHHNGDVKAAYQSSYAQLKRLSDEDLVDALTKGCHDALAVLFDRYYRLVLSIASNVLRDSAEAEDLLQTVFLEIYRVARAFDKSKGAAKAWILRYAYHRSLNRRAYLSVRRFYDRDNGAEPEESGNALTGLAVGREWSIFEIKRLLDEGFDSITTDQRNTLYLSFFEGLSVADIAERLGETVSNVRHHYYRGLMRLKLFIEGRPSSPDGERSKRKSSYAKS
jgi:RNA polymerase sigma-70 factor, ECF subfamily